MRIFIGILTGLAIAVTAVLLLPRIVYSAEKVQVAAPDSLFIEEVDVPEFLFGLRIDSMKVESGYIRYGQSLSDILLSRSLDHTDIFELSMNSKEVFDLRKIKAGRPFTLLTGPDSLARYMVYEPDAYEYIVFHLKDSLYTERFRKKVEKAEKSMTGIIENSLAVTVDEQGGSPDLTNRFVDVFAWQIDFFRLQKGDHFKVIYTQNEVEGVPVGIDRIKAIHFNHQGNDYWAYAFDQGNGMDYFDEKGASLRKALLKYPLEFTRISSRYSLRRFHPVQKRYKAHLGTDFSASTGTPIRTVGDGIVLEAKYGKYNGYYVKIRHNATYTTQYLHMSRIAKGIRPGVRVRQGQLIGYVGSTGLATGPHLCYRFWKNNVQVDALKVELPPSEPIVDEMKDAYRQVMDSLHSELRKVGSPVL